MSSPHGPAAKALVHDVIGPYLRAGDRISRQREIAYQLFRVDGLPAGQSKIDEALKGRAGAATLVALRDRAQTLGLLGDGAGQVSRLRDVREALNARDADFHAEDIRALDWAIGKLTSRR